MKKIFIIIGATIVLAAFWSQRVAIQDFFIALNKPDIPPVVDYATIEKELVATPDKNVEPEASPKPTPVDVPPTTTNDQPQTGIAKAINLAVPFQPQAPFAQWVEPYKEACEEASLIMVDYYLRGKLLTPEDMKREIDRQVAWQYENFSGHWDLSIEQEEVLGRAFYDHKFLKLPNLTANIIKEQLNLGRPVIIPAAGRELGNPYFQTPGPLYHMLVIKGYTADRRFITNDPGTRRGADFIYDEDVLMAAIKDWDGVAPAGAKIGLVMYK